MPWSGVDAANKPCGNRPGKPLAERRAARQPGLGWSSRCSAWLLAAVATLATCHPGSTSAATITLKDGRVLTGGIAPLAGIAEDPKSPSDGLQLILMTDNGLTRTFVPKRMVDQVSEADVGEVPEKFRIEQQIPSGGARINSVGPILSITPFDEHGRRILRMNTTNGAVDVIQGITEITPTWTKVESLRQYKWDMRLATSSIPRDQLGKIIRKQFEKVQLDSNQIEQRLKVVRVFLQADRFQDARKELEDLLAAFPDQQAQFAPTVLRLRQLSARRLLAEVNLRRDAGQHRTAFTMLSQFPAEDVAGDILQEVREKLDGYRVQEERGRKVLDLIKSHQGQLTDDTLRKRLEPLLAEVIAELNLNTIDRLAAYQQLGESAELQAAEKLSLAISGWLLGKDGATENLAVSTSLYEVRQRVRKYIGEPLKINRDQILAELSTLEGSTPDTVAKLLLHMKPPLETPAGEVPGFYQLEVAGYGSGAPTTYLVQLPPEYDPYRRYPAVVTLHGAGTAPIHQIDWWAGVVGPDGTRLGQASRQGYIVIAPQWAREHQKEYGFTVTEHTAVLNSLRDACKRFAIDTDRVFLSGHSMGGDAAWDIALAHPDLWAGVIPVVALADKYCAHYWSNAKSLPLYFVAGELDGGKTVKNSRELDRYLTRIGFNATVVEYLGRGHEHFSDEIQNLFDWMSRYRRDFFPREFSTASMRDWDNFFWWLELSDFPAKGMVDPADWPPPRGTLPITTEGTIQANNSVRVKTGAGQVTVWLSPELVDFGQPVRVQVNGGRVPNGNNVQPSLSVLLEDVRTRGDRYHPFWARIDNFRSSAARASVGPSPR